jgi:hypothetical protein
MIRSLALLLLASSPALAQAPHDPARVFTHEAEITSSHPAGSMVRLPLPSEVIVRVRPDLSDLRIHDREGAEVPFLIDSGARPWPNDATLPSYSVTPTAIDQRVEHAESLLAHWTEVITIAAPGPAPRDARWTIELDSSRTSFVRSYAVRTVANDGTRTELASGSVFRLQEPRRERLTIDLPGLVDGRMIELTLSGESGYIEPTLRLTATRDPIEAPSLELPFERVSQTRDEGVTTITIERPAGLVPDRIRVRTSTSSFHRTVRVVDLGPEGEREIARTLIFRAREIPGAAQIELDIAPARGERLRIEITDGDSPTLRELAFDAIVRQPTILFDAPEGDAMLRFGGGRARLPRYDLSRFLGTILGEAIFASELGTATLGPVRENERFDDGPALSFAMRPGRAIAVDRYTHSAPLTIASAREGLSRVRLSAALLSAANADLSDVRIVDGEGRQWPYLRSPAEESAVIRARIARPSEEEGRSVYRITMPVRRARLDRVLLHTDAPYVSRPYVLRGIDDGDRRIEISSGTLDRDPGDTRPIELSVFGPRVRSIELSVDDGSDAPIEFERAEVSLPSSTLFVAAPDGDYRVLAGDPSAGAPEYEITRASTLVLAVRAADARVGRTVKNPSHVAPPWYETADLQTWVLWTVLLLAVLLLGGLTLRLARAKEDEPPPPPAEPQTSGDDEPPPPQAPPEGESTKPVSF